MINLESPLVLTEAVTKESNLCHRFTERDLASIGAEVKLGFEQDLRSRSEWEKRYQQAMDLALQIVKEKTFPWAGASNVKFPLITIAALQWHSRAYPTLINGPDVVKCRVKGADPKSEKHERARRVGDYMSWQVLEEDEAWEEESDRALMQLPIIGCVFKKTRHDAVRDINVSETVPAKDFVLNYYAKSVETAARKTHIIPFHRNEIIEKMRLGSFVNCEDEDWLKSAAIQPVATPQEDRRTGQRPQQPDSQTPYEFLEQHVLMDLDDDGYAEPYIITAERNSGRVVRIVTAFEWRDVTKLSGKVVSIKAQQYFTKLSFIPSPDGGIYDMGFGMLLGPLNASVDSIINQLIDAGTLSTTAGGFLGKGVKIRGGEYGFRPFGWNRVDSTGEDLAKGIFPFPVREPSNVLFQLLGLLIDYTNRISGSTDIMVGENPGQNTPAATSQLMAEQGAKINSAIFKRVWRGMKQEFAKLYELNRVYVPAGVTKYGEKGGWIRAEDFTGPAEDIRPAADPNLTSDSMRMQQAQMVAGRAAAVGGYDKDLVERNLLRAMKIEDIDAVYPGMQKMPAPPPLKVVLEQMKDQREMGKVKMRMTEKMLELAASREKNQAEVELIKAQIVEILATIGAAQGAQQLQMFETLLKARESDDRHLAEQMQLYQQLSQNGQPGAGTSSQGGGVSPVAAPPGNPSGAGGAPTAG